MSKSLRLELKRTLELLNFMQIFDIARYFGIRGLIRAVSGKRNARVSEWERFMIASVDAPQE